MRNGSTYTNVREGVIAPLAERPKDRDVAACGVVPSTHRARPSSRRWCVTRCVPHAVRSRRTRPSAKAPDSFSCSTPAAGARGLPTCSPAPRPGRSHRGSHRGNTERNARMQRRRFWPVGDVAVRRSTLLVLMFDRFDQQKTQDPSSNFQDLTPCVLGLVPCVLCLDPAYRFAAAWITLLISLAVSVDSIRMGDST